MNRETLRKARVRLDCVIFLMQRMIFDTINWEDFGGYIFIDGSPQWRSLELYAGTLDIWADGNMQRFMMPLVSLARTMLDRFGAHRVPEY